MKTYLHFSKKKVKTPKKNNPIVIRLICFILRIINYFNYVVIIERNESKNIEAFLLKRGFVLRADDWYCKGFVYIRVLSDCIEIQNRAVTTKKGIKVSMDQNIIDEYINHLTKI